MWMCLINASEKYYIDRLICIAEFMFHPFDFNLHDLFLAHDVTKCINCKYFEILILSRRYIVRWIDKE